MKRPGSASRYLNRVARDRDRIARDERRARGEKTEQEQWADELAKRVQRRLDAL